MKEGDLYFVDEFNQEWNRDVQPMKGGYTDNFYYQFVARMRKYKGMSPPQAVSSPQIIKMDGNFSEWKKVTPVYTDFAKDTEHRDFDGVLPGLHYTNTTGRNDIVESRTAHDNASLYFYVKTTDSITPHNGKNWMLLFIDADNNKKTGWEGYDYLINAEVKSKTITTLKKWDREGWRSIQTLNYRLNKNEMEIKVPLKAMSLQSKNLSFNFHWADNIQKQNDITEFFNNGDSAPERRFDYHYEIR